MGRTGQLEQDNKDRTAITGKPRRATGTKQGRQNRVGKQDSQDRAARTEQPRQSSQYRKARTGQSR